MACVRRLAVGAVILNLRGEVLLVYNRGHGRSHWFLQFYFHVRVTGGVPAVQATDEDVTQVKWVAPGEIRRYMNYRPWVEPLFAWLQERRPRYHLS